MRIKINGEKFIAISLILLIIYLCLPISMSFLSSLLIRGIVVISSASFLVGMILLNKWKQLMVFAGLFLFAFLFWYKTWITQLDTLAYVFYCFASLIFVFGGIALYSSNNESMLKRLFIFITIIYFVTSITTIAGLNVYPLAVREFARGSTYDTSLDFNLRKNIYRRMNIASWSQIYGMLFAIPTSLFVWKKKKKIFFLALCVSLCLMLAFSQITFAVLMAALLIAGILIFRETRVKTIVSSLVVLAILCIILLNLKAILGFFITFSDAVGLDFLSAKLSDMQTLLLYRNAVGDAGARGELYSRSLDTFLKSPIIGLLSGGKGNLYTIGYHSDFFDMLATFGAVGLVIIISSVLGYFRFLKKINSGFRRDMILIFLCFILLFILNPVINSPQIFAGVFLYPVLGIRYCLMNGKRNRNRVFKLTTNRNSIK